MCGAFSKYVTVAIIFSGKLSMDCLPDANLVYIYPLFKHLYDSLVDIDKCAAITDVLQVCNRISERSFTCQFSLCV